MANAVREINCDYLIVGAGATGLSFLEELITSSKDLTAVLVDSRAGPGGHWQDSYAWVRLHTPALYYGLNSRPLGNGKADQASKPEIILHFQQGLKDLLATGRVTYLSFCRFVGNGRIVSVLDPSLEYRVTFRRKLVDATINETKIPYTSKPNYSVAEGVNFVPINGLYRVRRPWERYCVVGGGKTGIDAVLFLIDHNTNPDRICWIIPNDCWFFSQYAAYLEASGRRNVDGSIRTRNAILDAESGQEAMHKLEEIGFLLRLDPSIEPKRFRGATINEADLMKLRRVKDVVRRGRIARIEADRLVFQSGEEIPTGSSTLHIDCSANGIDYYTADMVKPIWDGDRINVYSVLLPPTSASACIIAALELKIPEDEEKKNSLLTVFVPSVTPKDFFDNFLTDEKTTKSVVSELGYRFFFARRCFTVSHMTWLQFLKATFYGFIKGRAIQNKLQKFVDEE